MVDLNGKEYGNVISERRSPGRRILASIVDLPLTQVPQLRSKFNKFTLILF